MIGAAALLAYIVANAIAGGYASWRISSTRAGRRLTFREWWTS